MIGRLNTAEGSGRSLI